jgi:pimeloyl-ACP methyl ester carboxylesterase
VSARRTGSLLAVEEFGHGETLVLIHGLATSRQIWSTVIPALARDRHVVSLDVPGFGESVAVGPGFDLNDVAQRIFRGLAVRGIRGPFDLVGHSLGGGIALALAALHPAAVRRLVLVAPAGLARIRHGAGRPLTASVEPILALRRALAPLADLRWGRRLLLATAAADGATIPPTQARLMIDASAAATRTAAALRAILRQDLRPLLRGTPAPLGAIWGTADRTIPARTARVISDARPDALLTLVEHAGHVPMIERPEEFVAALEQLLARLPKDATTSAAARPSLL